jgi:hypothetical protein
MEEGSVVALDFGIRDGFMDPEQLFCMTLNIAHSKFHTSTDQQQSVHINKLCGHIYSIKDRLPMYSAGSILGQSSAFRRNHAH